MRFSEPICTALRPLGLQGERQCPGGLLVQQRFEHDGWNFDVLAFPSPGARDWITIGVFEPDGTPASSQLPNGLRVHRAYVVEAAAMAGEAQLLLTELMTAAVHEFRDSAGTT